MEANYPIVANSERSLNNLLVYSPFFISPAQRHCNYTNQRPYYVHDTQQWLGFRLNIRDIRLYMDSSTFFTKHERKTWLSLHNTVLKSLVSVWRLTDPSWRPVNVSLNLGAYSPFSWSRWRAGRATACPWSSRWRPSHRCRCSPGSPRTGAWCSPSGVCTGPPAEAWTPWGVKERERKGIHVRGITSLYAPAVYVLQCVIMGKMEVTKGKFEDAGTDKYR